MECNFKFDKYVTNSFLKELGIAKYMNNEEILLKVEDIYSGKVLGSRLFKDEEEYQSFLEIKTKDVDWQYNTGKVLVDLIFELKTENNY